MKGALALALTLGLGGVVAHASDPAPVIGDYVEVRTAQVFAGGCIMGSEGEAAGREAIMAWRVARGAVNGVALDGLSVVAAVSADINLGTHELGGERPTILKSVLMVDERATGAQRSALVAMARALAPAAIGGQIELRTVPVAFQRDEDEVRVHAGSARLAVATKVEHSPACGAIKWFEPLARTAHAAIGVTRLQEWSGPGLGATWRQVSDDTRSAFFGTFSYAGQ
jgi:hypothetical protein